jgi:hypothetical protein
MRRVIFRVKGGLGNQLFIYAFGSSISKSIGLNVKFDLSTGYIKDSYDRTPRIQELIQGISETNFIDNIMFYLTKSIPKLAKFLFNSINITERSSTEFFEIPHSIFLKYNYIFIEGYFQSFHYFNIHQSKILFEIKFPNTIVSKTANILSKIKSVNSVSIHVRRISYDNLLPLEYYNEAIRIISEKISDPIFYVFSDDYDWCFLNLSVHANIQFIKKSINEIEDLFLMSQCEHHIIANSSFSWWGAMLGDNEDKIVIAPITTQIGVVDKFYPMKWLSI